MTSSNSKNLNLGSIGALPACDLANFTKDAFSQSLSKIETSGYEQKSINFICNVLMIIYAQIDALPAM